MGYEGDPRISCSWETCKIGLIALTVNANNALILQQSICHTGKFYVQIIIFILYINKNNKYIYLQDVLLLLL